MWQEPGVAYELEEIDLVCVISQSKIAGVFARQSLI